MNGWKLFDVANARFTFPAFTLASGASVNVWVRSGTNTVTDLFWGRNSAVWNNDGDTATLTTAVDTVVDPNSTDYGMRPPKEDLDWSYA